MLFILKKTSSSNTVNSSTRINKKLSPCLHGASARSELTRRFRLTLSNDACWDGGLFCLLWWVFWCTPACVFVLALILSAAPVCVGSWLGVWLPVSCSSRQAYRAPDLNPLLGHHLLSNKFSPLSNCLCFGLSVCLSAGLPKKYWMDSRMGGWAKEEPN